jgi:ArsR family transcriptional regulator
MARRSSQELGDGVSCTRVCADLLDERDAESLARSFAVLADPVRLRLLSFVAASGTAGVCGCDLVEVSGRSQPTVSHHMKILHDGGLVTREKRGPWVWYRIDTSRLDALRTALT